MDGKEEGGGWRVRRRVDGKEEGGGWRGWRGW